MARTARVRALRTVFTSPNVSPLADLNTLGSAVTATTQVAFTTGGILATKRFTPAGASTLGSGPGVVGSAATNTGWRDPVAENAGDQVTYAAGTWTAQFAVQKDGETLATAHSFQITFVLYQIAAIGGASTEIGRSTSATVAGGSGNGTNALATATFTTGSPTVLAAGTSCKLRSTSRTSSRRWRLPPRRQ